MSAEINLSFETEFKFYLAESGERSRPTDCVGAVDRLDYKSFKINDLKQCFKGLRTLIMSHQGRQWRWWRIKDIIDYWLEIASMERKITPCYTKSSWLRGFEIKSILAENDILCFSRDRETHRQDFSPFMTANYICTRYNELKKVMVSQDSEKSWKDKRDRSMIFLLQLARQFSDQTETALERTAPVAYSFHAILDFIG